MLPRAISPWIQPSMYEYLSIFWVVNSGIVSIIWNSSIPVFQTRVWTATLNIGNITSLALRSPVGSPWSKAIEGEGAIFFVCWLPTSMSFVAVYFMFITNFCCKYRYLEHIMGGVTFFCLFYFLKNSGFKFLQNKIWLDLQVFKILIQSRCVEIW